MATSPIVKNFQKYESEISSLLGVVVVLVITAVLFFFLKRSAPTPQVSDSGEQTVAEDLMKKEGTYTVKAGQGLWDVAEEAYNDGYKWSEIAKANNLKSPYVVTEGQVLTLPAVEVSPTPESKLAQLQDDEAKPTVVATASPVASPNATPIFADDNDEEIVSTTKGGVTSQSGSNYTVVAGDSLWEIAVKQYGDGYKWVEIYNANKTVVGTNPGIILPGQVLVVPGK